MENPLITYVQGCTDNKFDPQDVGLILVEMTRLQAIEWLCWNDPNGLYTDEQALLEDFEPLSEVDAKLWCMKQIWENQVVTLL